MVGPRLEKMNLKEVVLSRRLAAGTEMKKDQRRS